MAIKQLTPQDEIDRRIQQQLDRIEAAIVRTLLYIGEQCLIAARSSTAYLDQTGNLRSSTGYVVSQDGRVLHSSSAGAVAGGGQGARQGAEYARSLASEFPTGFALIVCAGMNYAGYVAATGRDVLDSAELLAERLVPQMLTQIGFKRR